MVTACVGTSSMELKKRLLASRVESVSLTMCVTEVKGVSGSLKPMWPLLPMPSSCRSMPPASSISLSYSAASASSFTLPEGTCVRSIFTSTLENRLWSMK